MGKEEVSDYPKLSLERKEAFLKDFAEAVAAGAVKLPTKVAPISPRKPKSN